MSPTPTGLSDFVGGPTSGLKTGYATKMAYDPNGKRIFWIGCDHAQAQTFMLYDEAANTWTVQPATPFAAATKHGYEHTTYDYVRDKLYHRPYGTLGVYRWDGGSSWTLLSYSGNLAYASAANGCEFFPDLGTNGRIMVFQVENGTDGELIGVDPVTTGVTTYAQGATLAGTGDPHNFALYSPTHQLVWFGGGNGSLKNWTINASGTVTALADAPSGVGTLGPGNSNALPVLNPATGNFLVFKNSTLWWDVNPLTGVWTARGGTAQAWSSNIYDSGQVVWGSVACAIQAYGVIVIIKGYSQAAPAQMWLFKP